MGNLTRIHRVLYREIRNSWAREFPLLKPFQADDLARGSAYLCDAFFEERRRAYFFVFFFDPHMEGLVTLDIGVSDSLTKWLLDPPDDYCPDAKNTGLYRIAAFLDRQDYWWDLVDMSSQITSDFESFGLGVPVLVDRGWKASSYSEPAEVVVREAVSDINSKLSEYVFPTLEIGCNRSF